MAHSSPVRVLLNAGASPRSDGRKPPQSSTSSPPSASAATSPSASAATSPSSALPSSPSSSRARREQTSTPLCEGCQSPHDASYGSGRFCSVHCARRVAASTKWHKQRLRARVKRLPSQKNASRSSSSHCSVHSTPFLLPASAAPMHYYRAPVARVAYDAAFVPQLVALPYADVPAVAVGVAATPYQQHEQQQLHQHVLPCASCITPYAALATRAPAVRRTSAAASIASPHQLFRYPSFKQNCVNPLTNSGRRNESHAVAEALLRLKCSSGKRK